MAALSSSRFFDSGVPLRRAPATSSARGTPHRMAEVLEIAIRVRAAAAEAALFLWTVGVLGFLSLIIVGFFL
jgi:hypothetical protein